MAPGDQVKPRLVHVPGLEAVNTGVHEEQPVRVVLIVAVEAVPGSELDFTTSGYSLTTMRPRSAMSSAVTCSLGIGSPFGIAK